MNISSFHQTSSFTASLCLAWRGTRASLSFLISSLLYPICPCSVLDTSPLKMNPHENGPLCIITIIVPMCPHTADHPLSTLMRWLFIRAFANMITHAESVLRSLSQNALIEYIESDIALGRIIWQCVAVLTAIMTVWSSYWLIFSICA